MQLPVIYGIPALHGYDPVLFGKGVYQDALSRLYPEPLPALKAYGVRWHVVANSEEREAELQSGAEPPPILVGQDTIQAEMAKLP